ncbi:MAG: hypothetical protein K6F50_05390 [Kiritimatiellae bacterium]|nr:hypothetical protein [Kiritimatiellia bacterium]
MPKQQNVNMPNASRIDVKGALIAGLAAALFVCVFPYPGIHPSVWEDVAAAFSLRPPANMFPGLFRAVLSLAAPCLPPSSMAAVLHFAGAAAACLSAALFYLLAGEFMPAIVRGKVMRLSRGRLFVRAALWLGTLFFICNDAVWRLCQCFSGATLLLLLALAGAFALSRYVTSRQPLWITASSLFWGVLAAESSAGLAGMALATFVFLRRPPQRRRAFDGSLEPPNPLVAILTAYWITFAFAASFSLTLSADIMAFSSQGGVSGMGEGVMNAILTCLSEHAQSLRRAATLPGWIMTALLQMLPCFLVGVSLRETMSGDRFMRMRYVLLYAGGGLVAWTQAAGFSSLWFSQWPIFKDPVHSDLLAAAGGALSSVSLAWILATGVVKIFFVNPGRLAGFQYQDAAESQEGRLAVRSLEKFNGRLRFLAAALPFVLVATVAPMRRQSGTRRVLAVVDSFLDATARECEGKDVLVTDGIFDAGIELAAHRQGHRLVAVALPGSAKPRSRDAVLRLRAATEGDGDERRELERGGSPAVMFWIKHRPEKLPRIAMQLGENAFKGDLSRLAVGETAMSVSCGDGAEPSPAGAIAADVLDLYAENAPDSVTDKCVKDALIFMQWRLARLAELRASVLSLDGWNASAEACQSLSEKLDLCNASYQALREYFIAVQSRCVMQIMLRDGLQLALKIPDFARATFFAELIVQEDPDDPDANFAIGMNDFVHKRYGRAGRHLERVLVRQPGQPAALNNLRLVALKLKRYEEAVAWGERALASRPDSEGLAKALEETRKELEKHRGK